MMQFIYNVGYNRRQTRKGCLPAGGNFNNNMNPEIENI